MTTPHIYPAESGDWGRYLGAAYYPDRESVRRAMTAGDVEPDAAGYLWHVLSGCMVIVREQIPQTVEEHRACDDLIAHESEVLA